MNIINFSIYCLCFSLSNFGVNTKMLTQMDKQQDSLFYKRIKNIDFALNRNIVYMDTNKFISKLLSNKFNKYYKDEKLMLKSSNSKQYCTLQITPGNGKTDFSFFTVGYTAELKENNNKKVIKENEFTSNSGIKLGLTLKQFYKIKDSCLFLRTINVKGEVIYYYKIYDEKGVYDNIFRSKYFNLPYYTCVYRFNKKNMLIEFGFGLTPSADCMPIVE